MNTFRFQLYSNIKSGIGESRNIGKLLVENGYNRVLILVDEGVYNGLEYYREIFEIIKAAAKEVFCEVLRGNLEPDYDYLDSIADKAREYKTLDVIIGIGGGSTMDVAKAVAGLMTNPGKGINYRGFDQLKNPSVPTIIIPTIAGSGSEATINASFIDRNEMKKLGINGRYMNATYAVLDAEWTMSAPLNAMISSGMDALNHSLEGFMCRHSSYISRIFSKEGFFILYKYLPSLIENPRDKESQQMLLKGDYLAGVGLFNSGSGIAGAFSYPLGVYYNLPHGIGNAIFLASVLRFNVENGYLGYTELFDGVEKSHNLCVEDKNLRFIFMVQSLADKLGIPHYLDQWGITRNNAAEVAKFLLPFQAAFDQNPIPFSADKDAVELLFRHVI